MILKREQLTKLFHRTPAQFIDRYLDPLNSTIVTFEINTPKRVSMFLAQVGHESGELQRIEENLNYSAERLLVVFPKYFRDVDVKLYARNPEKIANRVYANRMGNGPEASGDGYRYRGRGLIQLTGFNNYSDYAKSLGIGVKETVEYLGTPMGAVASSGWFWKTRGLNPVADRGDVVTATKLINGGTIGLSDRTNLYNKALQIFT